MEQIHKLRFWMVLFALAATGAAVVTALYFWHQFSEPFRQAEERNQSAASAVSQQTDTLPVYDDSFNLMLVNRENKLPSEFMPRLTKVDGVLVEERVAVYLKKLLAAAKSDGVVLTLRSGYVSEEEQNARYEKVLQSLLDSGLSRMKAEDQAQRTVGKGGYNEAQTGMSVCFGDETGASFETTDGYHWLLNHCISYGFILRYPERKASATGVTFRPEQFRFVGVKHAARMRELEMCLEEYVHYVKMQAVS
ncbi:MAG: M15 family metallopeptidase [Oscillospiraceae bacterium]|nr:M15 family metallopeptidase [Oscillospiraceae bacterium]